MAQGSAKNRCQGVWDCVRWARVPDMLTPLCQPPVAARHLEIVYDPGLKFLPYPHRLCPIPYTLRFHDTDHSTVIAIQGIQVLVPGT